MFLKEAEDGASDTECVRALALFVDGFGTAPDADLERRNAGLISGPGSATQVSRGCTQPILPVFPRCNCAHRRSC